MNSTDTPFSEALKERVDDFIWRRRWSRARFCAEAGVPANKLFEFLTRGADIRLSTASKMIAVIERVEAEERRAKEAADAETCQG